MNFCLTDLDEAFKLVKNQIGLSWKDLARSLPYLPKKSSQEIDVEIQEIEYEHKGKLREMVRTLYLPFFLK